MKHIVSFSGGKDSTAMLLRMIELNMPIDEIIFADTTLEFPEMYDYIYKIEKYINKKITILKPNKDFFQDFFYGIISRGKRMGEIRGFPPQCCGCGWSRDTKQDPLRKYCKDSKCYIGIAYDEKHRAKPKKDFIAVYPLVEWKWTESDCLEYLKKLDLINPLYEKFDRTGCWLCPKQNLKGLYSIYKYYNDLWCELKKLEKDSPYGFRTDITLEDLENKRFKNNKYYKK